jgi:hypothetical protein
MCGEFYPQVDGQRHQVVFKKYVVHEDGKGMSEWNRTESICMTCYGLYQDRTWDSK